MQNLEISKAESKVLKLCLGEAYRHHHREAWGIKTSGDQHYLNEIEETMIIIDKLLHMLGSSGEDALQAYRSIPIK